MAERGEHLRRVEGAARGVAGLEGCVADRAANTPFLDARY
jgi:hypothetical protein